MNPQVDTRNPQWIATCPWPEGLTVTPWPRGHHGIAGGSSFVSCQHAWRLGSSDLGWKCCQGLLRMFFWFRHLGRCSKASMAKQPISPLAIAWSRQCNVQLFEVAGGQDCQEQKQLLRGGPGGQELQLKQVVFYSWSTWLVFHGSLVTQYTVSTYTELYMCIDILHRYIFMYVIYKYMLYI